MGLIERPECVWQCSEHPEHKGWREYGELRGTCDICLAKTKFEVEYVPLAIYLGAIEALKLIANRNAGYDRPARHVAREALDAMGVDPAAYGGR